MKITRKAIKIGDSVGVIIPKAERKQLGIRVGTEIEADVKVKYQKTVKLGKQDQKIAHLTADFINRYRSDLESLAKK